MRVLKFIVEGSTIMQDPDCDFSGLFKDKDKGIRAEFSFSSDWMNTTKVIAFWSMLDVEYEPKMLDSKFGCTIPSEALARSAFKIQVFGKNSSKKMRTGKITVRQSGR